MGIAISNARGRTAKIWENSCLSKTQQTPSHQGNNTEHDPLLEAQPVEHIYHVASCKIVLGMPSMRSAAVDPATTSDLVYKTSGPRSNNDYLSLEKGVAQINLFRAFS